MSAFCELGVPGRDNELWDWFGRRISADGLFFSLFAEVFLVTPTGGLRGTRGINVFLFRSFTSNIVTNLARAVSGMTGAGLSFATPVLRCFVSKPKSVMWGAKT